MRVKITLACTECKQRNYNMTKEKKKWGDRKDGIWLKDIPAMNRIMPDLMPNRADNEADISIEIDTRPLNAYLEKLKGHESNI